MLISNRYPNLVPETAFTELLAGGSLGAKHSITCAVNRAPFEVGVSSVACHSVIKMDSETLREFLLCCMCLNTSD